MPWKGAYAMLSMSTMTTVIMQLRVWHDHQAGAASQIVSRPAMALHAQREEAGHVATCYGYIQLLAVAGRWIQDYYQSPVDLTLSASTEGSKYTQGRVSHDSHMPLECLTCISPLTQCEQKAVDSTCQADPWLIRELTSKLSALAQCGQEAVDNTLELRSSNWAF